MPDGAARPFDFLDRSKLRRKKPQVGFVRVCYLGVDADDDLQWILR